MRFGSLDRYTVVVVLFILSFSIISCGGGSAGRKESGGDNNKTYQLVESVNQFEPSNIVAKADLNNDGLEDLITGVGINDGYRYPVRFFISNGDGTFEDATIALLGAIPMFDNPKPIFGDFNKDGKTDVALFALGTIPAGSSGFVSQAPELFLSNDGGGFDNSTALADAVETYNLNPSSPAVSCPGCGFSGNAMSIKKGTTVDVNRDGNLDIYVESTGAENIVTHFYINNGDDTFTIDHDNRLTEQAHINYGNFEPGHQFWRHLAATFVDVNNDSYLDLVMAQLRADETFQTQANSHVFYNDGNGFFPVDNRINLPQSTYNGGFTVVSAIATGDINNDSHVDLVFAHERRFNNTNSDDPANQTGRFIQVLINNGNGLFSDETASRMGDQAITMQATDPDRGGALTNRPSEMVLTDVNADGHNDLVVNMPFARLSRASPAIYLNDGNGNFTSEDPVDIKQGDSFFGYSTMPIDSNADGEMDFASINFLRGDDGEFGTDDDVVSLEVSVAQ